MDRHHRAVLSAEVHRLVKELQIDGPLTRTALARRCQARHWTEGSLDVAIRAGVRQGALIRRPFDFIDVERAPRQSELNAQARAGAGLARRPGEGAHAQTPTRRPPPERAKPQPPEPRRLKTPEGSREAEPLIAMLLAVAMPLTLVVLAASGGGIALLVLAIAVMVAVCAALALTLQRLTGGAPERTPAPHRSAHGCWWHCLALAAGFRRGGTCDGAASALTFALPPPALRCSVSLAPAFVRRLVACARRRQ